MRTNDYAASAPWYLRLSLCLGLLLLAIYVVIEVDIYVNKEEPYSPWALPEPGRLPVSNF